MEVLKHSSPDSSVDVMESVGGGVTVADGADVVVLLVCNVDTVVPEVVVVAIDVDVDGATVDVVIVVVGKVDNVPELVVVVIVVVEEPGGDISNVEVVTVAVGNDVVGTDDKFRVVLGAKVINEVFLEIVLLELTCLLMQSLLKWTMM